MEKENNKLNTIRHSTSHIMAYAVKNLLAKDGKVLFGIGPTIKDGFYYDFDLHRPLVPLDLLKIEKEMKKLISKNLEFKREEITVTEARKKFSEQPYKLELIGDLEKEGEKKVSIYTCGDFTDLCAGLHIKSTKEIKAFKLLKIAGAYWKGYEKNLQLQRIYGTAFETQEELDAYSERLKMAEERDHRKLGKELDLFVFSDLVGPGMPLYTFRGSIVRDEIIQYSNQLQKKIGYETVHTPNVNKAELFKISGHYDKYKDDMLEVRSHYTNEKYYLKPMNCPQHTQIYASHTRSYRELPIRIADFANLYRDEKPGELSGLSRLRCFSQDDGHCFCREDQIEREFAAVLGIIKEALVTYGMDYWVRLSLRDKKKKQSYIGDDKVWEKSEKILESILKNNKLEYKKAEGEAAFYGPKMDIMVKDALGREWQISTIQLDFSMPARFGLKYVDDKGKEKTPVMIHRAIVGSPERFMSILIEHYAGAFPVWLAPVQVQIIPVGSTFVEHSNKLANEFKEAKIRVYVDDLNETVGYKIRKAEKQKVPYMLVIGEKEAKSDDLNVRIRGEKDVKTISRLKFIKEIEKQIKNRSDRI
ncbi:threonine--tRNA ligase [Candidatus Parcubacteria bacterium]|nr:MAG: threonine--tRNA ligase [Candidatus Parcubacteria bacterium]